MTGETVGITVGPYNLRYLRWDWSEYERMRCVVKGAQMRLEIYVFTSIFLDSVVSLRDDLMLCWTLITKRSLTMPPSCQLLHFRLSLLSQEWVVGSKLSADGRQQSWQVCKWGIFPAVAGSSTSLLLAALLFTSQEISSSQNMHLIVPGLSTIFSLVKPSFFLFCLIGALQEMQKPLQGSPM